LIEYTLVDENVAVVCGGAADCLNFHGLIKPGQHITHGCAWRPHDEL